MLGSLVLSAAWILPIGIWWMWKTFHPTSRVPPENHGHVQLSAEHEGHVSEDQNPQALKEPEAEARTDRQPPVTARWLTVIAILAILSAALVVNNALSQSSSNGLSSGGVQTVESSTVTRAPVVEVTATTQSDLRLLTFEQDHGRSAIGR